MNIDIRDLIENATQNSRETLDVPLCVEISDRINATDKE
jgi:hypothetical protein